MRPRNERKKVSSRLSGAYWRSHSRTLRPLVKVGPLAAKFAGKIALSDVNPPESYTLTFDGQGGAAGFGKGQARVKLTPQGIVPDMRVTSTSHNPTVEE